jgi:ABC-type histidine transport system ATPase subunit
LGCRPEPPADLHRPQQPGGGLGRRRIAVDDRGQYVSEDGGPARAVRLRQPSGSRIESATGAVDTQTADDLVALMRRLNHEEGVTFVLVTHDLELAGKADRRIRLRDGRVVSDDVLVEALLATA